MKKVVIMHGKDADPQDKWYPWVKQELEQAGYVCDVPLLPNAADPDIDAWMACLDDFEINSESVLVGHSRGGVAILRWLEQQDTDVQVGRVVLIGTNSGLLSDVVRIEESNYGFYTESGYDFEKLKIHCNDFVVMHSSDDHVVPYGHAVTNALGLGARLETYTNRRHWGTNKNGDLMKEIPEIVEIVLEQEVPYSLVVGDFSAKEFNMQISRDGFVLPDRVERLVESNWQEKLLIAQESGRRMFNGQSYRVVNWFKKNETITLELGLYDFKHRYGVICLEREGKVAIRHNGAFVGSTVVTSDGWYVMVQLSGKSMNDNNFDLLGGMVETETKFSGGQFLFDVLHQEMQEEAGIIRDDIDDCVMKMMYQGWHGHVGFYFETHLAISKQDVLQRFESNSDQDIKSLVFFERSDYESILQKHSPNKRLILKLLRDEIR